MDPREDNRYQTKINSVNSKLIHQSVTYMIVSADLLVSPLHVPNTQLCYFIWYFLFMYICSPRQCRACDRQITLNIGML